MSEFESFPTQEDWQELWKEMESEARNPDGIVSPEPKNFGKAIEPDWDSLLDD
jgi:hypothetical protein